MELLPTGVPICAVTDEAANQHRQHRQQFADANAEQPTTTTTAPTAVRVGGHRAARHLILLEIRFGDGRWAMDAVWHHIYGVQVGRDLFGVMVVPCGWPPLVRNRVHLYGMRYRRCIPDGTGVPAFFPFRVCVFGFCFSFSVVCREVDRHRTAHGTRSTASTRMEMDLDNGSNGIRFWFCFII